MSFLCKKIPLGATLEVYGAETLACIAIGDQNRPEGPGFLPAPVPQHPKGAQFALRSPVATTHQTPPPASERATNSPSRARILKPFAKSRRQAHLHHAMQPTSLHTGICARPVRGALVYTFILILCARLFADCLSSMSAPSVNSLGRSLLPLRYLPTLTKVHRPLFLKFC